jgi:hypothetical protein
MGIKWLKNKYWSEITREERFFCAHLYFEILKNPKEFIHWLSNKNNLKLNIKSDWEVSFEVCFYRDFIKKLKDDSIKNYNKQNKENYPIKRTFDLCMFSDDTIIIFEAKCQQGFEKRQIESFKKDVYYIKKLIENNIKIYFVSIASSIYYDNFRKYGKDKDLFNIFNAKISWRELNDLYKNSKILKRVDSIYKV